MEYLPREEAKEVDGGASLTAFEYSFEDGALDIARIEVSGRYPQSGTAMNKISKQACYILEGSGRLVVEGTTYVLQAGDSVLIQPGESFYWEANLVMLVPCTPAWSLAQYVITP